MSSALIERLEDMLARGMDDKLLRFSLGKAYLEAGESQTAAAHLGRCLGFDEQYSAAWKLYARALADSGDDEAAREAFTRGIAVAREHGDKQAEKEMQVFLRRLQKQADSP